MKIRRFSLPRSHIVIDDFFSKEDLAQIWSEIKGLEPRMHIGLQGSGQNRYREGKKNRNVIITKNTKINGKRNASLEITRKAFWDPALLEQLEKNPDASYQILNHCFAGDLHISSYKNGEYYAEHKDSNPPANLTIVVFFCREPKKFTGGSFVFNYRGKKKSLPFKNNRVVIFPSNTPHQVTPVKMKSKKFEDSRITLQIWPILAATHRGQKANGRKPVGPQSNSKKSLEALAKDYRREAYFSPTFAIDKEVWKLVDDFFSLVQFRGTWSGELNDVLLAPQLVTLALISNLKYIGRVFFEEKRTLYSSHVGKARDNTDRVRVYGAFKEKNAKYVYGYLISRTSSVTALQLFVQAKIGANTFEETVATTCDKTPEETIAAFRGLFRQLAKNCSDGRDKKIIEESLLKKAA